VGRPPPRRVFALIRGWKMPYRKFNLTVGELAPFLNGRSETAPRRLIDDFAGFAAGGFQWQPEQLLLVARHLICQIARANEHLGTPNWVNKAVMNIRPSNESMGNRVGAFVPAVHRAIGPRTAAFEDGLPNRARRPRAATRYRLRVGANGLAGSLAASHHEERSDAKHNYQKRAYTERAFGRSLEVITELDGDRVGSGEHGGLRFLRPPIRGTLQNPATHPLRRSNFTNKTRKRSVPSVYHELIGTVRESLKLKGFRCN
jgi:hypothetical protein